MKSRWSSLVVGSCNIFGVALLALSATAGGSAVRAGDPSTLQDVLFEPITKIVLSIEQRVAQLEATVAALADSFATERIVAQQLCVADGGGAQTCITKAQLDALLRTAMQVGQAPAAIEPNATERAAARDQAVAPVGVVTTAMPAEATPTITPAGAAGSDADTPARAVAATMQTTTDRPAAAAEESKAMPEVAAVTPPTALPTAGQPAEKTNATDTLGAGAILVPPTIEPAGSVVAAGAGLETGKPETRAEAEHRVKEEDPGHTGSVENNPDAPELNAMPAEAPPISKRTE